MTSIQGIIHGKTIELAEDPGIEDGQHVEVDVRIISPARKYGDGILRSAGGWGGHPELDTVMETIQLERKHERRTESESK